MSTFKAVFAEQIEGKPKISIQQIDRTSLPAGEVLVRVHYSDLNYKDGLAVTGRSGVIRKYPMIPGIDLAGTVVESRAPEFKPGDRVAVTGCGLSETRTARSGSRSTWRSPPMTGHSRPVSSL